VRTASPQSRAAKDSIIGIRVDTCALRVRRMPRCKWGIFWGLESNGRLRSMTGNSLGSEGVVKRQARAVRGTLLLLLAALIAICTWLWAGSGATETTGRGVVLRVDTAAPGNEFSRGAVGLSTEAEELGTGRLSAGHSSLVRLMHLLGPSVLRIGGNSLDTSWWTSTEEPAPSWATNTVSPADLAALRGLLVASGWRVILGVDLGHFEPDRAADEARSAAQLLGPYLVGIEIGNEPDAFGGRAVGLRRSGYGVGEYLREAQAYTKAIGEAVPGTSIYGPALSKTDWLTRLGSAAEMFAEITQHYYPTSTCPAALASEPRPTAEGLLSPAVRQTENKVLELLARAGALAARPTRIGETNAVACVGSPSASPTLASALWALDWALRAADSGVQGINFHGDRGRCGANPQSPICTPRDESRRPEDVAEPPEYSGLLAASQLEGGRFVPVDVTGGASLPDLTIWATLSTSGTIKIAIDNMAASGASQSLLIPMSGYVATEQLLVGPSPTARAGITFGGADVTSAGDWRPRPLKAQDRRALRVVLRPASAMIVTLRRRG
jgi:hypothetical protein